MKILPDGSTEVEPIDNCMRYHQYEQIYMYERAHIKENVMPEASCPARLLSPIFKVLAEPNRLSILCALGTECRPVTDIIRATELPQTNVSFHLRILREAGLVRAERRGSFVYYCLPDPDLLGILESLQAWVGAHTPLLSPDEDVDGSTSSLDRRTRSCG
ncbi:ArsR/SmtB family transcription factor [Acidithiobacillus thiooxidans]|nr:metalloregulator ArsR/SmtB family transcription factor [Acidithiobacillus thiooxidans]